MLGRYAMARVRLRDAYEYPWLYFVSDRSKTLSRTYSSMLECLPHYYRTLIINPKISKNNRRRLYAMYFRFKDACSNMLFINLEIEVLESYEQKTTIKDASLKVKALKSTKLEISQWLIARGYIGDLSQIQSIDKYTLSILENFTR